MSTLRDEIMKQIQQQQQLEQLRQQQRQQNQQSNPASAVNNILKLKGGINKFGNGLSGIGSRMVQSNIQPVTSLGTNLQNVGNTLSGFMNASKSLPSITNTTSNIGNLSNAISAGGNIAQNSGAISNAISNAAPSATSLTGSGMIASPGISGTLGSAMPFVGAGLNGLQAAKDAQNGDYIGAGLNGVAAGASFVPVAGTAVALGAKVLDSINKAFRGAKDKANAKAMSKAREEGNRSLAANMEETAKAQENFINDANTFANNTTLPNTTQPTNTADSIMNEISNRSTYTDEGMPTSSDLGVNIPNDTQTPQFTPSPISQNEDLNLEGTPTGGAASVGGNFISNLLNKNDTVKPVQVMAGDNEGAVIDKEASNNLAKNQGADLQESLVERIKNGLNQFKAGYDDNSLHGFSEGDLANSFSVDAKQVTPEDGTLTGGASQTDKTFMNRLGEAVGTGRRLMANPWVQAGIAGAISKADGGDIGDIATAAYKYGTAKAMSDQYYKQMHPDAKVTPVFNTYGAEDYKAKAYNDFNQGRTMISRRDLIKLNNPTWSDAKIDAYISGLGIDGDEMISLKGYDSVNKVIAKNKDLDIKKKKADDQNTYWNNKIGVDKQRVGVQQQNANTNAARLEETKNNNKKNYELKAGKQNVKNAEEELKARGYKKVNGQWVKQ